MTENVTALVTRLSGTGRERVGSPTSQRVPTPFQPDFLPDTEVHYVADRLAARIAANAVAQVDELALIGYPSLDPATRATYETAIRLAARRVLES